MPAWTQYPKCCQASVVAYFGGGHSNESKHQSQSYEEVMTWLQDNMDNCATAVFACPTGTQEEAIRALLDFGFKTLDERPYYEIRDYVRNSVSGDFEVITSRHEIVPMIFDGAKYKRELRGEQSVTCLAVANPF